MANKDKESRIERGLNQKLFFIEKLWKEKQVDFDVMGSTGNVYKVTCTSKEKWFCTCPDFEKRLQSCKHIYFVKIRVLKDIHSWDDLSRLKDLEVDKKLMIGDVLKQAYKETKNEPEKKDQEESVKVKREWIDQECIVCCEVMKKDDESNLFTCETCSNSIHGNCWKMWSKVKTKCVYCRSDSKTNKRKRLNDKDEEQNNNKYVNLLSLIKFQK